MQGRAAAAFIALLLLCFALFFVELGTLPFYSHGEPREALEVWDMIHRGEWVLPLRNGLEIPSKPPLFHWLGALVSLFTGSVDELSTRLPSAIAATLVVVAVFARASRWGWAAGLFAGVILATNFEFLRAARAARVDMVLTAGLTASFLLLERALGGPPPTTRLLALLYVFTGLAALAKGPVGIALPALVGLIWVMLSPGEGGRIGRIRQMRPLPGGISVLLIAGSWYALAVISGGDAFVQKQLLSENLERFVGIEDGGVNQSHPFYYYVQGIATGFAPWSLFLPALAVSLYRNRLAIAGQSVRFLLVCFLVVFVFYSSAAGKRTVYILSLYPILAVLLGAWWGELTSQSFALSERGQLGLKIVSRGLVALLAVVVLVFLLEAVRLPVLDLFGPLLHRRDRENLPMVRDLIRTYLPTLSLWILSLIGCGAALVVGARRGRWSWIFAATAGLVVGFALVANHVFHPRLAAERSFKRFALRTAEVAGEDNLWFYRTWDYGVVFYLGRRVPVVSEADFPNWKPDSGGYVILFEEDWNKLQEAKLGPLESLELVERSTETGHQGKTRLVLARLTPSDHSGAAAPPEPVAQ